MSKLKIILGIIAIVILVGVGYKITKPTNIISAQKSAIKNYEANSELFEPLLNSKLDSIFYNFQLISDNTISISFSNLDKNYMDSMSYNAMNYNAVEDFHTMRSEINRIEITNWEMDSFPTDQNGGLDSLTKNKTNWELIFSGARNDKKLYKQCSNLKINTSELKTQIQILEETDFDYLIAHSEGYELSYYENFDLQLGCIISENAPIKVNFGSGYLIRNKMIKFKNLDENVQSYIRL